MVYASHCNVRNVTVLRPHCVILQVHFDLSLPRGRRAEYQTNNDLHEVLRINSSSRFRTRTVAQLAGIERPFVACDCSNEIRCIFSTAKVRRA